MAFKVQNLQLSKDRNQLRIAILPIKKSSLLKASKCKKIHIPQKENSKIRSKSQSYGLSKLIN